MVKLENVPIMTYSVVFISFALLSSPKRKMDFVANKKPTPSTFWVRIKVKINVRSKYPIHLPALGRLSSLESLGVHLFIKELRKTDVGLITSK
ncbi:MAG: hypothetical protein VB022_05175 [Rikenellaceae bacterium]|nr:hypothetical protein [Rikenellaceae bacterium]